MENNELIFNIDQILNKETMQNEKTKTIERIF